VRPETVVGETGEDASKRIHGVAVDSVYHTTCSETASPSEALQETTRSPFCATTARLVGGSASVAASVAVEIGEQPAALHACNWNEENVPADKETAVKLRAEAGGEAIKFPFRQRRKPVTGKPPVSVGVPQVSPTLETEENGEAGGAGAVCGAPAGMAVSVADSTEPASVPRRNFT